MKMFEKAEEGIVPAAGERTADERRTGSEQVTAWLLDGRFFTIDPGGRITSWSPGAGETFGWKRADVVGSPFVETLLAPSEHPEQTAHIDEPFAGDAPADQVDNVVSIADAAGLEEARAQLDRARRDAEDARVELRSLTGQLEEARREAQRARNEVDVARQEAGDARDSAALAGREIEGLRGQIDESRRRDAELRAQVESARIRTEDAQREADRLRAELQEARSEVHGGARDLGTV